MSVCQICGTEKKEYRRRNRPGRDTFCPKCARRKTLERYWRMRNDPVAWSAYLGKQRKNSAALGESKRRHEAKKQWLNAGNVTAGELRALFTASAGKCAYCGKVIQSPRFGRVRLRGFDHVVPANRGGAHEIANIVVCCMDCNTAKGQRIIERSYP